MIVKKSDRTLYFIIFITFILPILVGLFLQSYPHMRWVSVPFHSYLEATGAMAALVMASVVYMMFAHMHRFTSHHRAAFALIGMGVLDGFHAMVYPGELFVWLHSMAVFTGGMLFSLVWLPEKAVSKRWYYLAPLAVWSLSLIFSVLSIVMPELLPLMLTKEKEFTLAANALNVIGGVLFIISALYFIYRYLLEAQIDDLLFAGHTLLFGSAGVLFFFSTIWDMQWWLWHFLRFIAYLVALYYMFKHLHLMILELYTKSKNLEDKNDEINHVLKALQEYKRAVNEGSIVSIGDLEGNITYVNDAMLKVTGYTEDELIGKPHAILRHPTTPKQLFKEMWQAIRAKQTWRGLLHNKKKNGESFYVNITIVPMLDPEGNVTEFLALRDNITELVNSQEELQKQFYTDTLTSLHNRVKMMSDVLTYQNPVVILLNARSFKEINEFYGTQIGDKVISMIGTILMEEMHSKGYALYRNHADEFILLKDIEFSDKASVEADIDALLKKFEHDDIKVDQHTLVLSLSAGISMGYKDLIHADMALKEAKRTKQKLLWFDESMALIDVVKRNLEMTKTLRYALDHNKVVSFFQPIVELKTQKIVKYETLVRLYNEEGELIAPFAFLEIAKQTRLYTEITRRMVRNALTLCAEFEGEISVNVTVEDILDKETNDFITHLIENTPRASQLVFELVESEGIENFDKVKSFIQMLKKNRVKIAIDDFGTGYSNFEYLVKLEADYIKIDGSLIKNVHMDSSHYGVVETIVSFAKKNRLKTIAEFVHSKEVLDTIEVLGIDYGQGFYLGKPEAELVR